MAANHYIPGAVPANLDDTADFPPLPESFAVPGTPPPPPASPHATDTWVMPKLIDEPVPAAARAPVPQPSTEELLRPYREERMQLRAELAVVNRERDELRRQLDAEAGSLRELERRLHEETERSTQAHDELAQLNDRSAGVASERDARAAELRSTEERLRSAEDKLRSAEDKLRASEAQVREFERRLQEDAQRSAGTRDELAQLQGRSVGIEGELESRSAELSSSEEKLRSAEDELRASEARARDLEARLLSAEAERSDLRARLEGAQAELALLAQQRERHAASQADAERERERDRARREAAFAHSQEELSELHKRVAAHGEVLRRVEGQRHVFDAQLREREAMLDEAHAGLREATEARERMGAELAAAIARAEGAEHRLTQRQAPVLSLPPAPPAPDIDPELPARVASLEAELADNRAQLESLREKLSSAQQAERTLRAELDNRARATSAGAALPWPAAEDEPTIAAGTVTGVAGAVGAAAVVEPEYLLVRTTGEVGIVHVLGRRTTIGRTPDNDLRVETDHVSRHHCVVLVSPDHAIVEDLNSTNGVYVNGARIMRRELREGDLITIGETSFRYVRKPTQAQAHDPA